MLCSFLSAEFARPILHHLRHLVHQANPDVKETRARRLETAVEWMSEGKVRNWKYVRK